MSAVVNQQRVSNVDYKEHDDGSLSIFVKPFSEAGKKSQSELNEGLVTILGQARAGVFVKTLKHGQAFNQWGQKSAGYKLINSVQSDDSSIYEIQELNESGGVVKKWRTAHIPVHLKELADAAGVPFRPLAE